MRNMFSDPMFWIDVVSFALSFIAGYATALKVCVRPQPEEEER